MRILVTGAAGFIGFRLAEILAEDPANTVICCDNYVRGEADAAYEALTARPNVVGVDIDLADRSSVMALPDDVDAIYHMAALNGTQNFYERPFEVLRCSTLPTFFLIEKYGPARRLTRFLYAGTSEAYASTVTKFNWEVPTAEDVPLSISDVFNPRWSYAISKLHGEVLTVQGARQFGFPFTIARYHNTYGPRMGDKHVVPDFLNRARKGIYRLDGWEDTRAFIYIDDSIAATIAVAQSDACIGEVVNIGSTREMKIIDVAKLMMDIAGMKGEIELRDSPQGSVRRRAPKTDKLKKLTGFSERWSLEDGLRKTIAYYIPELKLDA